MEQYFRVIWQLIGGFYYKVMEEGIPDVTALSLVYSSSWQRKRKKSKLGPGEKVRGVGLDSDWRDEGSGRRRNQRELGFEHKPSTACSTFSLALLVNKKRKNFLSVLPQ